VRIRMLVLALSFGFLGVGTMAGLSIAEGRPLSTALTGAAEVPGPGDADASGVVSISLNQGLGEVCFTLSWQNIDGTVVAAHIHEAPAGVAGPVVVPLFTGAAFAGTDSASGCISGVDEALIKDIRQNPEDYYVNVHSTVFPAGGIRGQLGK
jgi:hypothetical protein